MAVKKDVLFKTIDAWCYESLEVLDALMRAIMNHDSVRLNLLVKAEGTGSWDNTELKWIVTNKHKETCRKFVSRFREYFDHMRDADEELIVDESKPTLAGMIHSFRIDLSVRTKKSLY
jgi:hypothetical protein